MSLADRLAQARRDRTPLIEERPSGQQRTTAAGIPIRTRRNGPADPFADLKRTVHQSLLDTLGPKLYDARLTQTEMEQKVRQTLQEVLSAGEMPLTSADRARIAQEISDDILGYGPIEPYLRDMDVTEIMVNGADQIFVERAGRLFPVDGRFADEAHLRRTIDKIVGRVGRRVDESSPMVDARLPDGSRVNAIIPPLAVDGSLLTIRKFATDPLTADDLVAFGTVTRTVSEFLSACVRGRPDRIVVGEIRDAAALDMLQAMNTGHDGSVGTVHANGPRDVLSRVETMVLMAGVELPIRAIREQVASAVDLFVFDHQMGIDEHGRTLGMLKSTGLRPKFMDKLEAAGVRLDVGTFAFER